ncbi:ribonuclease H-like domain-containing protein [Tanacetum coccineum]
MESSNIYPCSFPSTYNDIRLCQVSYMPFSSMGGRLSALEARTSGDVFIDLLMYADDIVIIGTTCLKLKNGICLSQRKYSLELLYEYGLLAAKHVDTPLTENTTLNHIEFDYDKMLRDIRNYQRLVGKLIYLTNTRPDIFYVVHCLSQFMHAPLESHLDVALRVLRSSAEVEYRSMASTTCEVIWLSNLLGNMGVKGLFLVVLYYDNSSALQIAANSVFHEKSKHFEIDVHLVREKVVSGVIKTEKTHTSQQIADILTKALDIRQRSLLCEKFGLLDMTSVEQKVRILDSFHVVFTSYTRIRNDIGWAITVIPVLSDPHHWTVQKTIGHESQSAELSFSQSESKPSSHRLDKHHCALEVVEGAPDVDEGRLEEDVHGMRGALGEQREVLDSMASNFSRFTTWTVTGLSRMMDQAGFRYTSFSDYHIPYVRRTMHRTDDANTSARQQPDP